MAYQLPFLSIPIKPSIQECLDSDVRTSSYDGIPKSISKSLKKKKKRKGNKHTHWRIFKDSQESQNSSSKAISNCRKKINKNIGADGS